MQQKLQRARQARERARQNSKPSRRRIIAGTVVGGEEAGQGDGILEQLSAASATSSAQAFRSASPTHAEDIKAEAANLEGAALVRHLTGALFEAVANNGSQVQRRRLCVPVAVVVAAVQ